MSFGKNPKAAIKEISLNKNNIHGNVKDVVTLESVLKECYNEERLKLFYISF